MNHTYKGHIIEVDARPAPDVEGRWRVYVTVAYREGDSVRTTPLSFKDSRTFASEAGAEVAGLALGKAQIDGP